MSSFGANTDLTDQPIIDLLQWALLALRHWELYIVFAIAFYLIVYSALAGRSRDSARAGRSPWIAYGTLMCGAAGGSIASVFLAMHLGTKDADSLCSPAPVTGSMVAVRPDAEIAPVLDVQLHTNWTAMLIGETSETYNFIEPKRRGVGGPCTGFVVTVDRKHIPFILYGALGNERNSPQHNVVDHPADLPPAAKTPTAAQLGIN